MNAISLAPINSDLYFHEMHKLDKDPESKASYRGEGTVWQQHNYMPVEEMAAKWKQFDKLQWLEVSTSNNFYLFFFKAHFLVHKLDHQYGCCFLCATIFIN